MLKFGTGFCKFQKRDKKRKKLVPPIPLKLKGVKLNFVLLAIPTKNYWLKGKKVVKKVFWYYLTSNVTF